MIGPIDWRDFWLWYCRMPWLFHVPEDYRPDL